MSGVEYVSVATGDLVVFCGTGSLPDNFPWDALAEAGERVGVRMLAFAERPQALVLSNPDMRDRAVDVTTLGDDRPRVEFNGTDISDTVASVSVEPDEAPTVAEFYEPVSVRAVREPTVTDPFGGLVPTEGCDCEPCREGRAEIAPYKVGGPPDHRTAGTPESALERWVWRRSRYANDPDGERFLFDAGHPRVAGEVVEAMNAQAAREWWAKQERDRAVAGS